MTKINSEAFYLVRTGSADKAFEMRSFEINAIQDNEIIIETEAFGLNFADVMARRGLYQDAPPMPCVVGYEVVGKVVDAGKSVNPEIVGKRVAAFCRFGGYARHVVTREDAAVIVEDQPAAQLLSLCTQGVTAYYMASYLAPVRDGDKVLIHAAAGGVGSILIQLAKNQGGEVYAKVGSDEKIEHVQKLGADFAINYRKRDYAQQLKNLLNGSQLDVSFNPAAGGTYKKDMSLLGAGGRMILFGGSELSNGKWGVFSKLNFIRKMGTIIPVFLMMQSKNVLGVNMLRIADNKPEVLKFCLEQVIELYKKGLIHPQVGHIYRENELVKAHADLESGKTMGKLVVQLDHVQ